MVMSKTCLRKSLPGNSIVMFTGVFMVGLMTSVLAIDLPAYFVAQNQLQTAVNAAAIAGAYELPVSEQDAEEAALEMAAENPVANYILGEDNLQFQYETGANMTMMVSGELQVPTIMGKVLCALTGNSTGGDIEVPTEDDAVEDGGEGDSSAGNCNFMTIYAHAKAVPAARDTILVIDTSSSMSSDDRISKVKTAAKKFVDEVNALTNQTGSIDRIGLATFDKYSGLEIGLTAKDDFAGSGFTTVKNKITGLSLYSGGGWNTNYYVGLKEALDELEANGRKNAKQTVIFLTDGYPNLPAPNNYISYSNKYPYTKCTDIINYSDPVRDMCYYYWSGGRKKQKCYYMPDEKIEDWMIEESGGKSCGDTYLSYMESMVEAETARAEEMGVTIHTISISELAASDSSSLNMIRRMTTHDDDWTTDSILEGMSDFTEGEHYASESVNLAELEDIYSQIAQDVKVKLAN